MAEVILFIGLIFFGAHLFTAIFEKTKIPDVLLLIIMGIIGGPILNIVSVEDFGKVGSILSSLALIIILFESGVTLNIQSLRQALASTLVLSLIFFGVSVTVIALIGVSLLQLAPIQAVILGAILGGTSSAVVIPMVKGLSMTPKTETTLILESAISDVLCIVLVFGLLDAAANPDVQLSVATLTIKILASFFFAFLIGLIGSVVWLLVLNSVRQFPNTILSTFAFVFILFGISEMLEISGAITALAFGFFLTNYVKFDILFKLNRFHKRKLALIKKKKKADKDCRFQLGNFTEKDIHKSNLSSLNTKFNRDLFGNVGLMIQISVNEKTSSPSFSKFKSLIKDAEQILAQFRNKIDGENI